MSENQPKLQSSLGIVSNSKTKNDRVWNMGSLAIGQVLKIHPKRYTADVRIYSSGNILASPHTQEGRYSCRIGVGNAGYDTMFNKPYGEIIPIQKGSIVLVGFINNKKEKPVILRVFHDITELNNQNNMKNILDAEYSNDNKGEISRYLKITPIQDFVSLDRNGNLEIASHSKSFLVAKSQEIDEEEFDFENLTVKTVDQKTISVDQKHSIPLKIMAVFRDHFLDELTNWLKVFIDASKTSFRLAKLQQSENKSTYFEVDQNGGLKMRRQMDTRSFDGSKHFTEMSITPDGNIEVNLVGNTTTKIVCNSDGTGVTVTSTDAVKISSDTKIDLSVKGSSLQMTPSDISLTSNTIHLN